MVSLEPADILAADTFAAVEPAGTLAAVASAVEPAGKLAAVASAVEPADILAAVEPAD